MILSWWPFSTVLTHSLLNVRFIQSVNVLCPIGYSRLLPFYWPFCHYFLLDKNTLGDTLKSRLQFQFDRCCNLDLAKFNCRFKKPPEVYTFFQVLFPAFSSPNSIIHPWQHLLFILEIDNHFFLIKDPFLFLFFKHIF